MTTDTFSSSELTTKLAELRTRRGEFLEATARAKSELAEARGLISLLKPKTLEAATIIQARHTVLLDTTAALDVEIAQTEAELESALAREQRERQEAELAQLTTELDAQNQEIEAEAIRIAQEAEAGLRVLTQKMYRSWEIASAHHSLKQELGFVSGPGDSSRCVNDGELATAFKDSSVFPAVATGVLGGLSKLRFVDAEQRGLDVYREGVAHRIAAETRAMPPQLFAGCITEQRQQTTTTNETETTAKEHDFAEAA